MPFSVKDLVITKGVRTTFGTPLFADNVPTEDAPMVARLKAAGAIMVGKTNTPTFGWLGATHNLLFGATRNPWRLDRTPGGSSGGASAAVAAGLAPIAVGTDGGGSIRIPASFAGIFGHKPSYGRIPTYPASAAWSVSHIGPMTRTVADAALAMQVCAGPDERDPSRFPASGANYVRAIRGGRQGAPGRLCRGPGKPDGAGSRGATGHGPGGPHLPRARLPGGDGGPALAVARANAGTRSSAGGSRRVSCRIETAGTRSSPASSAIIDATAANPPSRYVQAWFDRLAWWQHPRAFFERYDLLLTPTVACPPFGSGSTIRARSRASRSCPTAGFPTRIPST